MGASKNWNVHWYPDRVRLVESNTWKTPRIINTPDTYLWILFIASLPHYTTIKTMLMCSKIIIIICCKNPDILQSFRESNAFYLQHLPKFLSPLNKSNIKTPMCIRPRRAEEKKIIKWSSRSTSMIRNCSLYRTRTKRGRTSETGN